MRRASWGLAVVVWAAMAMGGCGSAKVQTFVCQPACPTGTHCEASGCVLDQAVLTTPPDLAMGAGGCQPGSCSGATPVCNARGFCVGCAADGDCPVGQVCHSYSDSIALCVQGCSGDARCPQGGAGGACCNGACVDTSVDVHNCGACGHACVGLHAQPTCGGGACVAGPCSPGWGDCNADPSDGCEVNLAVDPGNCGVCGTTCATPNGRAACSNGCYLQACDFGWDDCNADTHDGCETSVLSDRHNCGACGTACANQPNAQSQCAFGECQVGSCTRGFGDCDGVAANGCETTLVANNSNCGACGVVCAQGLICQKGSCTCPMCNNVFPNASARCFNNMCSFDKCNPGYGDCDKIQKNGCEALLISDVNNCGACGNVCPNNAPVCQNGMCTSIDLNGVFNQYDSEGRTVYIWKTDQPCADLSKLTTFCTDRGLAWWSPKSDADAQSLVTNAFNLDGTHTWIQVYGLKTGLGGNTTAQIGDYQATVDQGTCVSGCPGGNQFGSFRKWACSMCDPMANQNQSCCWDKGHPYDWLVCEG